MPKTLAAWCTVLFFLWYFLAIFVQRFNQAPLMYLGGVLALGVAVFTLLGR
jgi:hypothetical protein